MRSQHRLSRLNLVGLIGTLALAPFVIIACSLSSTTTGSSPTSTVPAPTVTTLAAAATNTPAGSTGYRVLVYFSRHPDTDNNVNAVFPVQRTAPNLQVATYAMQQLIAGPTSSEAAAQYFTPLPAALTGSSNCGGPDFQITLDTKGSTPELGTATLRFCRPTQLPGDLTGSVIKAEIVATLTQFPTIKKVVILNNTGNCWDDASGQNLCLK